MASHNDRLYWLFVDVVIEDYLIDHWHSISFGICMEVYCFERFESSTVVVPVIATVGIAAEVDGSCHDSWNSLMMVLNKFR